MTLRMFEDIQIFLVIRINVALIIFYWNLLNIPQSAFISIKFIYVERGHYHMQMHHNIKLEDWVIN